MELCSDLEAAKGVCPLSVSTGWTVCLKIFERALHGFLQYLPGAAHPS